MFPAPCLGQRLAGVPGSSQLHPRVAVGSGDHPFIRTSKGRVDVDGYLSLCSFMRGGGGSSPCCYPLVVVGPPTGYGHLLALGCLAGQFGVIADLLPWGCGWLGRFCCIGAPPIAPRSFPRIVLGWPASARVSCLVPLVL